MTWARRLTAAGVDGLQLREKDLDDRALFILAGELRQAFPPPRRLLVNGRLDVALAAGADGVHLPARGLPIAPLRRRFGVQPLIGRSTHHLEEVARATEEGADYVTFGPVWETPSKVPYGPPVGLDALARAARMGIPVYALGGVTGGRFAEAAAAGAAGAAGIRLFQDADDLATLVREARRCFARAAAVPARRGPGMLASGAERGG